MSIKDEVEALKALVEKTISARRPKPYDLGTSDEWEQHKDRATRMWAIHVRNHGLRS